MPTTNAQTKIISISIFLVRKSFLRPDYMGFVTMCGMVYIPHAIFVATNDLLNILPTDGVMGGDLKATIENL